MTARSRARRAALAMLLTSGWACAAPRLPRAPMPDATESLSTDLDRIVAEEVDGGHVPGAVVLVGHAGRIVYERAIGARALVPTREPMTADTIFDAASLTKVVATTTAVLQLVDAGRIDLDAPAARYWPAFGDAGKDRVTVRQLLAHTAGLRADLDLRITWTGTDAALARVAADRPIAEPGTRTSYSDLDFLALGEIVRRVSGRPLDRYCAEHVFGPLGMTTTAFRPPSTWRDRIAPTTRAENGWLRGVVHDPTARRMDGVAGHAGLFTTARDLARFAQMLLDGGEAAGTRVLRAATVVAMSAPQGPDGRRGLGWELGGPQAVGGGRAFSPRAFGHTGYTGTSLWIDPETRTYAVILTNRVHPDDRGIVAPLRMRVAEAVASAFPPESRPTTRVHVGIDVLEAEDFAPLAGLRVGLITNRSGRDGAGRRTADVLASAPRVRLTALFAPEHGIEGAAEGPVRSGYESTLGVPVYSLYGDTKRPTAAMLADVDALVFDVQDVGVRFYTFVTTMAYALEAAAEHRLPFYVLDRPNPIDADVVQGPILEDDLRSFTGYFALPVRYGLTIGELATLLNAEKRIGADLHVVRMNGYTRDRWYDETGLAWVPPSPNLRSLREATLYPGVALVEGADVSVGRGTEAPFELVGAPWIDGRRLAGYLDGRAIPGVRFEPADFTPSAATYRGRRCGGIRIVLVDRTKLDAPALGVELASALHRLYANRFALEATTALIGARWVVRAMADGEDPRAIAARWQPALGDFGEIRRRYLLY